MVVVGVVVGLISDFEILRFGTWWRWLVLMVGSISDFEILSFGTWWRWLVWWWG